MATQEIDFVSPLPHPGEVLREDYMEPLGLTAGALARAMGLPDRTRIERLSREQQPVTADTALRLGKVFDTSAQFWINLQSAHDLSVAAIAGRDQIRCIAPLAQLVEARTAEPHISWPGPNTAKAPRPARAMRDPATQVSEIPTTSTDKRYVRRDESGRFGDVPVGRAQAAPGERLKKR